MLSKCIEQVKFRVTLKFVICQPFYSRRREMPGEEEQQLEQAAQPISSQ